MLVLDQAKRKKKSARLREFSRRRDIGLTGNASQNEWSPAANAILPIIPSPGSKLPDTNSARQGAPWCWREAEASESQIEPWFCCERGSNTYDLQSASQGPKANLEIMDVVLLETSFKNSPSLDNPHGPHPVSKKCS